MAKEKAFSLEPAGFFLFFALVVGACGGGDGGGMRCEDNGDCPEGRECRGGRCVRSRDAGAQDAPSATDAGQDSRVLSDAPSSGCRRASDCPDDGNACTQVSCSMGRCVHHFDEASLSLSLIHIS
ncbi:MAG: hypothetical protein N2515_10515, partial [Deltaproteobacteria bacterium]|nr:hypothetical protein [Deltaproteobacteria bacterium]